VTERTAAPSAAPGRAAGFSVIEMLVAMGILLAVMAGAMSAMLQFTNSQTVANNRSAMHAGVRSATELLQQEVGQAGRVSLAGSVTLTGSVAGPGSATVGVSSTANMFVGEKLVVDTGDNQESVAITAISSGQITGVFAKAHNPDVPVIVLGGFDSGVVPTNYINALGNNVGSTGGVLKLYGDVNGDGQIMYVEYICDTVGGNLYRRMMPFDATSKPALTVSQVLLDNIEANPGGTPCFTYQQKTVEGVTYVLDVAISLTSRTQFRDRVTRDFQRETKALLNVSPRNVFDVWQLASMGIHTRVQPMPPSVALLLP
jgi:type II secretory pathway pseudopilin PulG